MKMKFAAFVCLLFAPLMARAQATASPAPAAGTQTTFTITAAPIALPGNHATFAGTAVGATINMTSNFAFRDDNLIGPAGSNFQGYFGGIQYQIPAIGQKINATSPTINGFKLRFYITASAGIDRISQSSTVTNNHYAFLAGGGFTYDMTNSGNFTLGAEIRYAKLPGYANNTALVSFGPAFHF